MALALAALLSISMYAVAAPAPAAHAASHATVMRSSFSTAIANFAATRDGVEIQMTLVVGFDSDPNVPGPAVGMSLTETDSATGALFIAESRPASPAPGLKLATKSLLSAFLPDTPVVVTPVDANGEPTGVPSFTVHVSASWTGVGPVSVTLQTIRDRVPQVSTVTIHLHGRSREATAISSFSYTPPPTWPLAGEEVSVTDATAGFAIIDTSRSTIVEIQH
ncbi:MAG TPA: hypothetical protein VFU88_21910 [Ktedonobacterales bacterium]|nr:hypothetical protein [Ktedonobacterales bacterium]